MNDTVKIYSICTDCSSSETWFLVQLLILKSKKSSTSKRHKRKLFYSSSIAYFQPQYSNAVESHSWDLFKHFPSFYFSMLNKKPANLCPRTCDPWSLKSVACLKSTETLRQNIIPTFHHILYIKVVHIIGTIYYLFINIQLSYISYFKFETYNFERLITYYIGTNTKVT